MIHTKHLATKHIPVCMFVVQRAR